jgi:hypothetical protein
MQSKTLSQMQISIALAGGPAAAVRELQHGVQQRPTAAAILEQQNTTASREQCFSMTFLPSTAAAAEC